MISKGRYFQGIETSGSWERYEFDQSIPESITPAFVEKCIIWAVDGRNAERIEWDIHAVPV